MSVTPFKIVAVDGGAASGKSSTSRGVAERLNFLHVDTGAHYRALTLACINAGIDPVDTPALEQFLATLRLETIIEGRDARVCLNGTAPSAEALRGEAVNNAVSRFAAVPQVRTAVKRYQRDQARVAREAGFAGLIMDGRDIGTVIFPEADLKVFLFADEATRDQRRKDEGQSDSIRARDQIDQSRKTAPLRPADDAVRIDNSTLSLEQVIDRVCALLETAPGRV